MTATELLREARDVLEELRRQIHQRCDSEGAEGDFDIYKAWPLVQRIDAFLSQPEPQGPPEEPARLALWRLARRPPEHPQGGVEEILDYIDALRSLLAQREERITELQAALDLSRKEKANE